MSGVDVFDAIPKVISTASPRSRRGAMESSWPDEADPRAMRAQAEPPFAALRRSS